MNNKTFQESNGGVYLPGADIDQSQDDVRPDKLVCDESTYVMLHKAHTGEWLAMGYFSVGVQYCCLFVINLTCSFFT